MLEVLKALILDFQEGSLETGVPRRLGVRAVPGKATVCIGVRRSGKTTFFFQLIDRLLKKGVSRENILYLNFFDDRLHGLEREGLGLVVDAYFSLFPEKKNKEKVYFFFDGVQAVRGWEPFVDRLMRTERCQVYLTGSSAKMLSKEIATQMRGRALTWEVFPFSFREFLDFQGVALSRGFSSRTKALVRKGFEDYWERGGFTETAGVDGRLRVRIHQEYFHAILYRDLVERHDISHPRAVLDLARRLVDHVGSLYTVNSLFGYLKSLGHKLPKTAVSDYLDWFEDAFFLFTVRKFDASYARSKVNPKKIFCVDHALVRSVGSGVLVNSGHLLENLVFLGLRRYGAEVFYFRTRRGREVDFLVQGLGGDPLLVQVCETLADPETRKRELAALEEAMAELGLGKGMVVTRNEEGEIRSSSGEIRILPAWRFLLDLPEGR